MLYHPLTGQFYLWGEVLSNIPSNIVAYMLTNKGGISIPAQLSCSICEGSYAINNTEAITEPIYKDIMWWAKIHEHKETKYAEYEIPQSIKDYVYKESGGNVKIDRKTTISQHSEYSETYICSCKICGTYNVLKCSEYINHSQLLDSLIEFANSFLPHHKHVVHYETFNILPTPPPVLTADSTTNMMGDLTISTGKNFGSLSVSQETLKWVAKQSNFNVDLQAKVHNNNAVSAYSAICTLCNERHVIVNSGEFLSSSRENKTWQSIKEFCNTHRHNGPSITEEPTGRKFKTELYGDI